MEKKKGVSQTNEKSAIKRVILIIIFLLVAPIGVLTLLRQDMPLSARNATKQTRAQPQTDDEQKAAVVRRDNTAKEQAEIAPTQDDDSIPVGGPSLQEWLLRVETFDSAMQLFSLAPEDSSVKNGALERALDLAETYEQAHRVYFAALKNSELEKKALSKMDETSLGAIEKATTIEDVKGMLYYGTNNDNEAVQNAAQQKIERMSLEEAENTTNSGKLLSLLRSLPTESPGREATAEEITRIISEKIEGITDYADAVKFYQDMPIGSPLEKAAFYKMIETSKTQKEARFVYLTSNENAPDTDRKLAKEKWATLSWQTAQNANSQEGIVESYNMAPDEMKAKIFNLMLDKYCGQR